MKIVSDVIDSDPTTKTTDLMPSGILSEFPRTLYNFLRILVLLILAVILNYKEDFSPIFNKSNIHVECQSSTLHAFVLLNLVSEQL